MNIVQMQMKMSEKRCKSVKVLLLYAELGNISSPKKNENKKGVSGLNPSTLLNFITII
jgi:hypothetical protein